MASTAHGRTVLIANPSADLYGSDRMMLEGVRGLVELGWHVVVTSSDDGPLIAAAASRRRRRRVPGRAGDPQERPAARGTRATHPRDRHADAAHASLGRRTRSRRGDGEHGDHPVLAARRTAGGSRQRRARARSRIHAVGARARTSDPTLAVGERRRLQLPDQSSRVGVCMARAARSRPGRPERYRRPRPTVAGPYPPRWTPAGRVRRTSVAEEGSGSRHRCDRSPPCRGIAAELDIVGDVFRGYEWYERQLREQISRLALEDRVRIVGFQRMVWDIVSAADVAVVPSRGTNRSATS